MLDQTLGPFNDHFRYPFMVLGQLVKSRINDFHIGAFNGFPDIRDFLGTLIDQQDDQVDLRIVIFDGTGHLFEQGRLTGLGRGDDHAPLAFADRTDQVHDPHGDAGAFPFQADPFIRKYRCHVFKVIAPVAFFRRQAVDGLDI